MAAKYDKPRKDDDPLTVAARENREAWHKIISMPEGKKVLADIIFNICHNDVPSVIGNDTSMLATAFNEGARQVAVRLSNEIKILDIDAYCGIVKKHHKDSMATLTPKPHKEHDDDE